MTPLLLAPALLLAAPASAQPSAATYRALGTEPFWSLTIDARTIRYRPAEGRPLTVARPRRIAQPGGERYRTRQMTIDITHRRCSDGMSDRSYADTVRVTIGRRTVSGCGGAIVADGGSVPGGSLLAGTRWYISAIDGRPVRLDRPATVTFAADRIGGRICNSFGGTYRFHQGTLTTRDVIATQMACAGPVGEAERAFFRLSGGPMKISQGDRDTLVLTRGRSSVTLRRDR